jgi:hypothetical protein
VSEGIAVVGIAIYGCRNLPKKNDSSGDQHSEGNDGRTGDIVKARRQSTRNGNDVPQPVSEPRLTHQTHLFAAYTFRVASIFSQYLFRLVWSFLRKYDRTERCEHLRALHFRYEYGLAAIFMRDSDTRDELGTRPRLGSGGEVLPYVYLLTRSTFFQRGQVGQVQRTIR